MDAVWNAFVLVVSTLGFARLSWVATRVKAWKSAMAARS